MITTQINSDGCSTTIFKDGECFTKLTSANKHQRYRIKAIRKTNRLSEPKKLLKRMELFGGEITEVMLRFI